MYRCLCNAYSAGVMNAAYISDISHMFAFVLEDACHPCEFAQQVKPVPQMGESQRPAEGNHAVGRGFRGRAGPFPRHPADAGMGRARLTFETLYAAGPTLLCHTIPPPKSSSPRTFMRNGMPPWMPTDLSRDRRWPLRHRASISPKPQGHGQEVEAAPSAVLEGKLHRHHDGHALPFQGGREGGKGGGALDHAAGFLVQGGMA